MDNRRNTGPRQLIAIAFRSKVSFNRSDRATPKANQRLTPPPTSRWNLRRLALQARLLATFRTSDRYWENRYRSGLTSGAGSFGSAAAFKAEVLNDFVRTNDVSSVIEFGCGDGNQLQHFQFPLYLGLDVSRTAIDSCRERYRRDCMKSFLWYDPERTINAANFLQADLTLSLDVVYHLVEDQVYSLYLQNLFSTARRFVIIYSSDNEDPSRVPHVRHRRFTEDVARDHGEFYLMKKIENRYPEESFCEFFIFARSAA